MGLVGSWVIVMGSIVTVGTGVSNMIGSGSIAGGVKVGAMVTVGSGVSVNPDPAVAESGLNIRLSDSSTNEKINPTIKVLWRELNFTGHHPLVYK